MDLYVIVGELLVTNEPAVFQLTGGFCEGRFEGLVDPHLVTGGISAGVRGRCFGGCVWDGHLIVLRYFEVKDMLADHGFQLLTVCGMLVTGGIFKDWLVTWGK